MKTKLTYSIIFLSLIFFSCEKTNAQAPNWLWAKSAGGTSGDEGRSVATDASGNVFMTNWFLSDTISFGSITLTNTNAGSSSANIFIVKYDAGGNVIWAKSEGGNSYGFSNSISIDTSGNVFITGVFNSPTISFGTITLTNAGSWDIFIVKYDANGNMLWAKSAGGYYDDSCNSISTDASGNAFMTGYFSSDTITFGTITLTSAGYPDNDIFIVKYDASGNVLWAQSAGDSTGSDHGSSVATDANGNVFMTGYYDSYIISFGTITISNNPGIFLVKYDASGNALWVKVANAGSSFDNYFVSTDVSGNVFMTGNFFCNITFGATTLTNNCSNQDIFIVKYDASGNLLWAKRAGGNYTDAVLSVATDANGNVLITGQFKSATTFGTTTLTNANGVNYQDIFIAKYDASGNVLWAKSAGGNFDDVGYSVSTDASGNVFMTGAFSTIITFGSTTLTNAGFRDIFIAKLDTVLVTGNNEIKNTDNGILLFPNPATNLFTINISSNYKKAEVTITDITGKIIYTATVTEQEKTEVNTKDFAAGVYLVQIQTTDFIETKKLIVKN